MLETIEVELYSSKAGAFAFCNGNLPGDSTGDGVVPLSRVSRRSRDAEGALHLQLTNAG